MSDEKLTMKTIPASERPYEKLENLGAAALSDAELISILLRSGTRTERATEVACRMLAEAARQQNQSPLAALFCMSLSRLQEIAGIGRVKAIQLKAVMEISSRLSAAVALERFQAGDPETVAAVYMERMRYLQQEIVKLVFLDNQNQYVSEQNISVGSVNLSILSTRDIFAAALERKAVHLILLHNHPSGDPAPSRNDIAGTHRLAECGRLLEIPLLDHIIIGNGTYYSMREQGIL